MQVWLATSWRVQNYDKPSVLHVSAIFGQNRLIGIESFEIVLIDLLISNKGIFKLKKINSSSKIKKMLPKLDSILRRTITKLPKVTPAKKRGIPVAIQYQLPITIKIKEELN